MHVLRIVGLVGDGSTAERYIETTSAPLIARGVRVSLLLPFATAGVETLRCRGIDVSLCPIAASPSWSALRTAAALVQTGAVDVIETHEANAHVLGALVAALTGRRTVAILHEHAITMLELEAALLHDDVHVLAPFKGTALQARVLGVDETHVHVIRPPVALEEDAVELRLHESIRIASDVPIVGAVGPASETFVRAAALVARRVPIVHFASLGGGTRATALAELASKMGIASRFHVVDAVDAARVMPSLAIVVAPVERDGATRFVLEALARGRAVVAARAGGVAETIVHGESGWLVDQDAVVPIADAVVALLRDAPRREAMGRNARESMRLHHAPDDTVAALCALYARLGRRAPAGTTGEAALPA